MTRHTRRRFLIALAVSGAAGLGLTLRTLAASGAPTAGNGQEIPEKYRERAAKATAWLDAKLAEWKPAAAPPMKFGGYMIFSSENVVAKTDASFDGVFLDLFLNELDVDVVIVAIYPYQFREFKARYERIFERVRRAGKKLYVSYMIGSAPRTFDRYRAEQREFVGDFVRNYRPDYFVIVDEYTTISKRGGFEATQAQWRALVEEMAAAVKAANRQTRTVATGHALELDFLERLADIRDVDCIGLNVWGLAHIGFQDDRIGRSIERVRAKGKGVVLEQTWAQLLDEPAMRALNNTKAVEPFNAKYIRALACYAQRHDVELYAPFYVGKFFSHDTSASAPEKLLAAIREKRRSAEFTSYKETIGEFRNAAPSEPKDGGWLAEGPIYNTNAAYYKGGLNELSSRVPHLKEIGIKTIYLMALWSNTSYTPDDYYKIAPWAGTEKDLKELVRTVHEHGMRILLDLVTGYSNNKPQNVLYTRHPEWHLKDRQGNLLRFFPDRWGPALDRANPEVIEYFVEVAGHYVEKFDIDGWRIDAPQDNYDPRAVGGDHTATALLRAVKKAITVVKPDAAMLAELPGPATEGNPAAEPLFDAVAEVSYDWFLVGQTQGGVETVPPEVRAALAKIRRSRKRGEDPASEDIGAASKWARETHGVQLKSKRDLRGLQEKLLLAHGAPRGFAGRMLKGQATAADLVAFLHKEKVTPGRSRARWFENHDTHVRTLHLYRDQWKNLLVLISTVPGVPMIHAGQETGETKADSFSGKTDESVESFFRKVFSIRSKHPALRRGTVLNAWESGDAVYAYSRIAEKDKAVVVLNFSSTAAASVLDVPFTGESVKDELSGETYAVPKSGKLKVSVPAYGSRILVSAKP